MTVLVFGFLLRRHANFISTNLILANTWSKMLKSCADKAVCICVVKYM